MSCGVKRRVYKVTKDSDDRITGVWRRGKFYSRRSSFVSGATLKKKGFKLVKIKALGRTWYDTRKIRKHHKTSKRQIKRRSFWSF